MNTAAYCRTRKKLKEEDLKELCLNLGQEVEKSAGVWKWEGREVMLVDGTTVCMEDTLANQKQYPQNIRQKKGLGQPIMRILGIFGLSSGSLLDMELGSYSGKGQGEISLFRMALSRLKKNDLLLFDRFYTNYFLHHLLLKRKIDFVVRARDKFGERSLKQKEVDKLVSVSRSSSSSNYDSDNAEDVPREHILRVIRIKVEQKGYRVKSFVLMTSLLDKKKYPREKIGELYKRRWNVELDIRNLKQTLGADYLRCKDPSMIRKELYTKVLAFNLVRKVILATSKIGKRLDPRKCSFKTAISLYVNLIKIVGIQGIKRVLELLMTEKLNAKYRREPRALKKRMKTTYGYLTVPRDEARKMSWGYRK